MRHQLKNSIFKNFFFCDNNSSIGNRRIFNCFDLCLQPPKKYSRRLKIQKIVNKKIIPHIPS